jgi:transcriptional regulator with XRE-family HTH domain
MTTTYGAPAADEALGRAIHHAMWDRRVTQLALARELGIQQSTLSKKLRGERPWSVDELIKVADALHMDARDLLTNMWGPPKAPVAQRIELPPSKRESATSLACVRIVTDRIAA